MKQVISILIIAAMFYSCNSNGQDKAIAHAKKIQAAIKPGTIATSAAGFTLKAKIDGKDWTASSMVSPDAAGRIVGYYNNNYLGLPYSKTNLVTGKKIIIGDDNAVDLSLNDGCLWTNPKGEIEITKADVGSAEGKFFFTITCSSKNKTLEVKEGFFRVQLTK
jgi:hypothetical protein